MPDSNGSIGAGFIWVIFLFAISLWICAYLYSLIIVQIPCTTDIAACQGIRGIQNFGTYAYGFIDSSFFVIILVILFLGLYDAWANPSKKKAIVDLFAIFILAYFGLAINAIIPALSIFNAATLAPVTYTFFNSSYKIFAIFIVLIISVILNIGGSHKN